MMYIFVFLYPPLSLLQLNKSKPEDSQPNEDTPSQVHLQTVPLMTNPQALDNSVMFTAVWLIHLKHPSSSRDQPEENKN